MREHQFSDVYRAAFEVFLANTNEKRMLLNAVRRRIQASGAQSLLDIGAGNGDLAVPLARLVRWYEAVEKRADYAMNLRARGITVHVASFPCEISRTFDMVLACHVLPWRPADINQFLVEAWSKVKHGGSLILITYDDERGSAWNELLERVGLTHTKLLTGRFNVARSILGEFGAVEEETIVTCVETENCDDFQLALSFVWSDGKPQRMNEFLEVVGIRELYRYKTEGLYRFPFTHFLFEVKKTS